MKKHLPPPTRYGPGRTAAQRLAAIRPGAGMVPAGMVPAGMVPQGISPMTLRALPRVVQRMDQKALPGGMQGASEYFTRAKVALEQMGQDERGIIYQIAGLDDALKTQPVALVLSNQGLDTLAALADIAEMQFSVFSGKRVFSQPLGIADGLDARQIFDAFHQRIAGIRYQPKGYDCNAISSRLLDEYKRLGVAGAALIRVSASGGGRIIIKFGAEPADPNWNGAPLLTDDLVQVPGFATFENHVAVKIGTTIYDPTTGYVGSENDWVGYLRPANRKDFDAPILDDVRAIDPEFRLFRVDCMNWINFRAKGFMFAACAYAVVYEAGGTVYTVMLSTTKLRRVGGLTLGAPNAKDKKLKGNCC